LKDFKNITNTNDFLEFLKKEKLVSDHIIDNSRSMISVINRNYIYEKVNATFCKAHLGMEDSIVGKTLADVWGHDTFRDKIKNNINKCFSGATVRYEASFTTPQSGRRFFEVVFRPFPVGSGEITHLLAETFDITDLKLTEKIASEKENEFRRFETNLPIGFLRCLPDGKIIHANKAFLIIMESEEEITLCSTNLRKYYAEESLFDMQLQQLLDGRPKSFGRVPLKTCRNNDLVCRISAFMVLDESANQSYIDFSFEDSSRELMLETRLLQAQKLETIGALAGGIAHDFNNILATISGYSELLRDDLPESSPSSQKVSRILMAVSKARSLTNQILTFSRQMEQEKVIVRVSEVLKETVGFMKATVPSGIIIRSNIRIENTPVFADPTQLFRVFMNLMTNAVQSMEGKGGNLSVSLKLVTGRSVKNTLNKDILADEYALIVFRDTGTGMDPSVLQRIFEPFFTTREVGKGTGLGLSVVHGIVSEMGGDILVSSEKYKGSVFYVYLPVTRDDTMVSEPPESGKRILFITGNRHESNVLSLALESSGYTVSLVSDRKQFLKEISDKEQGPDLVLYMSEAKEIRIDDLISAFSNKGITIPVILITDSNQDLIEEKSVSWDFIKQRLVKPVSLKEIKNAIHLSIV
jgi:PAS domain S-box-containing protein